MGTNNPQLVHRFRYSLALLILPSIVTGTDYFHNFPPVSDPEFKTKLNFQGQNATGLEFFLSSADDDSQLVIDKDFTKTGSDAAFPSDNLRQFSALEIVRMFLRELKGLPRDKPELSANDKKIAWSFFPYRLKKLAKIELNIYIILKNRIAAGKKSFPVLESYLKDVEGSNLFAIFNTVRWNQDKGGEFQDENDPYMYIGSHPLLIYRMIRRFAEDLSPILWELEQEQDIISAIEQANPELEIFPTNVDLEDALESLMRIQKGTTIKTKELAEGILENVDTKIQVNAFHALEIGAYHITKDNYDLALQWMFWAWEKVSTSPIAKKFPTVTEFFYRMLEHTINLHNERWEGRRLDRENPGVFTTNVSASNLTSCTRVLDILLEEAAVPSVRQEKEWNWSVRKNFAQVCSGINLQTAEEKKNLRCWYLRSEHPYWLINPLKIELLNEEPALIQAYEFIGEKLMEKIKEQAVPGLARSKVIDLQDHKNQKVDPTRTSSQVWLYDNYESGKFLQPLSRKLELLSGLSIVPEPSSDAYQVASYGPSHHYEPHLDAFELHDIPNTEKKGNRINTMMGYLSDVAAGGRTGFPILGAFAEPIKGSLVVWENMENDIWTRNPRTYHGGCPVVLGVKWITNKWVYTRANTFTHPCPLVQSNNN